jgi:hypothetical protein
MIKKVRETIENIKNIWNLPKTNKEYHLLLARSINEVDRKINERTTVHADVHYKGEGTQIIVIGRYRNKDYVRAFTVRQESLSSLIEMLRTEEKYAKVGRFDMIGGLDFSAVYDRKEF